MTDDREVRELERRWRASSAVADRAAWLVALQRLGQFSLARLEVAALCGDAAAIALLVERRLVDRDDLARLAGMRPSAVQAWPSKRGCPRVRVRPTRFDPVAVLDWRRRCLETVDDARSACALLANRLQQLEPEAAERAALAACWRVEAWDDGPNTARYVLVALEARLAGLRDVPIPAISEPDRAGMEPFPVRRDQAGFYLLATLASLAAPVQDAERRRRFVTAAVATACWALVCQGAGDAGLGRGEVGPLLLDAFTSVDRAVRQEVVPWALGLSDPISERVTRRRAEPDAVVRPSFEVAGA